VSAFQRVRRVARKPPGYIARRLADELRRELARRELAAARDGRGRLSAARILPGGLAPALQQMDAGAEAFTGFAAAARDARASAPFADRVARRAALARRHVVELFGDAPLTLPGPLPWSLDPNTGDSWPLAYYRRIDYVNRGRASDVKIAWELSRLRHAVALAQAVAALSDSAALRVLEEDVTDWQRRNPMGWSVNWTVGMEVALRAVNLICVDALLAGGRVASPLRPLLASLLYQHGWFLYRNLEISDVNGNHYLSDGVGLVWLGRYLKGVGEADRWLERGAAMVEQAADRHVLADGLDQEGSLRYHTLVTELFAVALQAAPSRLKRVAPVLERMLQGLGSIAAPDGTVPNIGDDDGGRALALSDTPSYDARRVLALGAALLQRPDLYPRGTGGFADEARWLLGPAATRRAASAAGEGFSRIRLFREAGVAILGDGPDHVAVDVGPIGFRGIGGHGHVDAMSFEARIGGKLAVPDSGTGSYTGDPVLRQELRGPRAHTLVLVNGQSYARPDEEFLWRIDGDAPPDVHEATFERRRHRLFAEQVFPAAGGEVRLRRVYEWRPGELRIEDELCAPQGTTVEHLVQLPDEPETVDLDSLLAGGFRYLFELPASAALLVEEGRRSERYASSQRSWRAVVRYRAGAGSSAVALTLRAAQG
jgi:hypothetical protein